MLYISHRSTALRFGPRVHINVEIVPLSAFPWQARPKTGRNTLGQRWQDWRLCKEPCRERQHSARAVLWTPCCSLISPWQRPASEWHSAQAGDGPAPQLAARLASTSPGLHQGCTVATTSAHGSSRLGIQFIALFVSLYFRDMSSHL